MRPVAPLLLLLVCLLLQGGRTQPVPEREIAEDVDERGRVVRFRRPAYWNDPRFNTEISYAGTTRARKPPLVLLGMAEPFQTGGPDVHVIDSHLLTGRELALAISASTGVPVLLEGKYSRSQVTVPRTGITGRELLDALKRVLVAHWYEADGGWVLATFPEAVPRVTLSVAERDRRRAAHIRDLVLSLQAAQWGELRRTGLLPWEELTRDQRVLVRQQLGLDFYDPARSLQQAPHERVMLSTDIALRFTGEGVTARFGIVCMAGDGGVYAPTSPFYHPVTRELTWGVMPPR